MIAQPCKNATVCFLWLCVSFQQRERIALKGSFKALNALRVATDCAYVDVSVKEFCEVMCSVEAVNGSRGSVSVCSEERRCSL